VTKEKCGNVSPNKCPKPKGTRKERLREKMPIPSQKKEECEKIS